MRCEGCGPQIPGAIRRATVVMETSKRASVKLSDHVSQVLGGRLRGNEVLTMVHNTALQMMQDRGLVVTDACTHEEQLMRRIDDARPLFRAKRPVDGSDVDNDADSAGALTLVFIDADERTGVKLVRTLRDAHGEAALCVISADGVTPFAKREFAACSDVEFWQVGEMLFNPSRHELVPRHVALTRKEVDDMQRERCILPSQWPTILATDIIVRWYHFPKGAVVRIERTGLGHERGDYFRKVIAA